MRKIIIYGLVSCVLALQGCYIQRYNQLKHQYEAFSKEVSKVRSKNTKLKSEKQSKLDSISMYVRKATSMKQETMRADSMIEVYTLKIRAQLGEDAWGDSVKTAARTAATITYMSKEEKDVLYWLNLARLQPDLYAELYIDPFQQLYDNTAWRNGSEEIWGADTYITYINTCYLYMAKLEARNALIPDERNYKSAECHAIESGKTGYVGHDRTNCKEFFSGECCDYGPTDGFEVIFDLLLDIGVPSLGHRHICLGNYQTIGISQKPHLTYRFNTVLDFD